MLLPAFLLFVLVVAIVVFFLVLRGKRSKESGNSILPTFATNQKTYREQDKAAQTAIVSEWYAESLDKEFKDKTLADVALKIAASQAK